MGKECKNGDIIVIMNRPPKEVTPWHTLVIGRLEEGDGRYYLHAADDHNEVRDSQKDARLLSGLRASSGFIDENENCIVFRLKDEALLNNFVQVTKTYAPRVSDAIKKTPLRTGEELKHQSTHRFWKYMSTPLLTPDKYAERSKDNSGVTWGLYRNIRAYLRYKDVEKEGIPKPLSKNWGVECSQFLLYSYEIATILTNFPQGLPEEVTKLMEQIENERSKKDTKINPHVVDILLTQLTEEIKKIVDKNTYEVLSINVKHYDIQDFYSKFLLNDQIPIEKQGTLKAETLEIVDKKPQNKPS